MKRIGLALLVVTGCVANDPQDEVPVVAMNQPAQLAISVSPTVSGPAGLEIAMSRAFVDPPHNGAKPIDCMRVMPSLTVTVNQAPATVTSVGGIDLAFDTEDNCRPAVAVVALDPLPATMDVVLADETGQVHMTLTYDNGLFHITGCDAAACKVN